MKINRPNLFAYATSELSQDAFLAWFIEWADQSYDNVDSNLHSCAVKFVKKLIDKGDGYSIDKIEVGRQWNHVDVWAKVNDQLFVAIEDKTNTSEHSNQLERYKEMIEEDDKLKGLEPVLVYFKMTEQSNFSVVEKADYRVFSRKDMIPILREYDDNTADGGRNNILVDYYRNLLELDQQIDSFRTLKVDDWHYHSWAGFYSSLQKEFEGGWGYVHNPSGGFVGYWWDWRYGKLESGGFEYYLQLEQDKLVIKQHCYDRVDKYAVRDLLRDIIFKQQESYGLKFSKSGRIGKYMSVAKLDTAPIKKLNNGALDYAKTFEFFKIIMEFMTEIENRISA